MNNVFQDTSQWWGSLSGLTQAFIALIVLLWLFFNIKFTPTAIALGPTILTTIGIFATFLGVALGLSRFDSANVAASVPSLLAGLKTAFWGSVFGVGAAVLIKARELLELAIHPDDAAANSEAGDTQQADLLGALQAIKNALSGTDDGSLLSQLKLARQDSNDKLDALRNAQVEALQKLSEMGSKALVEALRDVIKDFNSKITEQFGDNFKELNAAVGRLLEWQEQYKEILNQTSSRITELIGFMGGLKDDLVQVISGAQQFTLISERLGKTLSTLENSESRLQEVSSALVQLLDSASTKVPQIEAAIIDLTVQMTHSAKENQQIVNEALTANTGAIKSAIQLSQQEMTKTNSEFSRQAVDLIEKTKQQVTELDKALSEELTKSLESLAKNFTALSEKFAYDYGPIAEKLKRIVDIGRDLP